MLKIPNPIDPAALAKALAFLHERALNGMPSQLSAAELAGRYTKGEGTLSDKVDQLLKAQIAASASVGFSTGLGGLLTLPFSLPTNLATNYFLHLRMASAVAALCGHDAAKPPVRSLAMICLLGADARASLEKIGIHYFTMTPDEAMATITADVQSKIADQVATRILAKLGARGAVAIGRTIPIVGGIVSGGLDAYFSLRVGQAAKSIFLREGG